MGNITSLILIVGIWKPYFLYSKGFKISVIHYWVRYIKYMILIILPAIVCIYLWPAQDFSLKFLSTIGFYMQLFHA